MSDTSNHKTAAEILGIETEPRNARDRLILQGIDLFYRQGFHAVGLDQLLAAVGVTKTTFYKHFESKDQLILEAIRRRDAWEMDAWRKAVEEMAGFDPRAQLVGFFDVLDLWFNAEDFGGCLFINAAAEFPNPADPVHQAAAEHKVRNRDLFRDMAAGAHLRDPDVFADVYTMLFEGTLVLRQVHGRDNAAQLAKPVVRRLIDAHTPT